MKCSWRERAAVFIACLLVYLASPVITSCDSAFTVPTALSLIREGNLDLNEFPGFLARHNPTAIQWINGRAYSIFPPAISLMAIPAVAVSEFALPRLLARAPGLDRLIRRRAAGFLALPDEPLDSLALYPAIEWVAASVYAALAAAAFHSLARRRLSAGRAAALTALLAFGTSFWSVASRALWQHGPALMCLLLAMGTLEGPPERRQPGRAGVYLAVAYLIRPTFALPAAAAGLFLLLNDRRAFVRFAAGAALPLACSLAWNRLEFGVWLPAYFNPARILQPGTVLEALAGNLVSPARGLFVYSPFLLIALPSMARALARRDWRSLDVYWAGTILLHWLAVSGYPHWWGGYSVGPRFMMDVLPEWFWFLIPLAAAPPARPPVPARRLAAGIALAGALAGVAIHGRAATSFAVYYWNDRPTSVDRQPARLWEWRDPPFLRRAVPPRH